MKFEDYVSSVERYGILLINVWCYIYDNEEDLKNALFNVLTTTTILRRSSYFDLGELLFDDEFLKEVSEKGYNLQYVLRRGTDEFEIFVRALAFGRCKDHLMNFYRAMRKETNDKPED